MVFILDTMFYCINYNYIDPIQMMPNDPIVPFVIIRLYKSFKRYELTASLPLLSILSFNVRESDESMSQ